MINTICVFLLVMVNSIAFTQNKVDGKWYVYDKGNPAEIDNYEKDSITHGHENIDYALGFPERFSLSRDLKTYNIPKDELQCTELLLIENSEVQNMTECIGIEDKSYWLNGGKNGAFDWINKKTIRITYLVGLGQFTCTYRLKAKKNILTFILIENVQFTKLDE